MKTPLVSICIPTYNGETYLQEALDSVKNQTYKNIEVIISDDNSKDRTLEICEKFKEEVSFPVFIYNHGPSGIGANWNNCIKKANGEYIQFLFQDDILFSGCIEIKLFYLLTEGLKAVCSKREIIDEQGKIVNSGNWYHNYYDLQKIYLRLDIKDFYILEKKDLKNITFKHATTNIFGEPIAFMFDLKLFQDIGYFSIESKQILDIEFGYKILKNYPIGIIEKPLYSFRLHENQTSSQNKKISQSLKKEFDDLKKNIFLNFFPYLSSDFKKKYLKEKFPTIHKIFSKIKYF